MVTLICSTVLGRKRPKVDSHGVMMLFKMSALTRKKATDLANTTVETTRVQFFSLHESLVSFVGVNRVT